MYDNDEYIFERKMAVLNRQATKRTLAFNNIWNDELDEYFENKDKIWIVKPSKLLSDRENFDEKQDNPQAFSASWMVKGCTYNWRFMKKFNAHLKSLMEKINFDPSEIAKKRGYAKVS